MNQNTAQPPATSPAVFAVVLNWNGYEDTAKCLASLYRVTYPNLKIVLVDNGSTDGSAQKLERAFSEASTLKLAQNGGYAAGNNAGIKFALTHGADYILVLNNDVVVEQNFISPMLELFERVPLAGLVACKVYYASEPQYIYAAGGTFSRWLCTGVNDLQGKMDNLTTAKKDCEREITFVPGCVFLARAAVFEKIGMLDEKFFLYFEDLEFSRRARQHFQLFYTPQARIYHKSGAGTGWASYTPTYLYYHTRNRLWVFRKDPAIYRIYVFFFTLLNALAKTLALLLPSRPERQMQQRISALWRGVKDGIVARPTHHTQR